MLLFTTLLLGGVWWFLFFFIYSICGLRVPFLAGYWTSLPNMFRTERLLCSLRFSVWLLLPQSTGSLLSSFYLKLISFSALGPLNLLVKLGPPLEFAEYGLIVSSFKLNKKVLPFPYFVLKLMLQSKFWRICLEMKRPNPMSSSF